MFGEDFVSSIIRNTDRTGLRFANLLTLLVAFGFVGRFDKRVELSFELLELLLRNVKLTAVNSRFIEGGVSVYEFRVYGGPNRAY